MYNLGEENEEECDAFASVWYGFSFKFFLFWKDLNQTHGAI